MRLDDVRRIEAEHALIRAGSLRHTLDDHQLRIYDHYRSWEVRRLKELEAGQASGAHRVFVVDCGRQVGKTHATSTIRVEDAMRIQAETFLIATGTEKALKELVIPVINTIVADFPDDVRPRFISSHWGMRAGFFFPSSGSTIKLVGIDVDPDSLRGPGLAGANVTEAGFVSKLSYAYNSVIAPQFSRRKYGTAIFESSAPKERSHDFDRVFKPDAERRKAYVFMTIYDNTTLSNAVKNELVESARAVNPDDADREYLGIRTRDRSKVLIPEFDRSVHVADSPRPRHALAACAMDPGMKDLFFVGWGYWDAARAKLVVERDWSGRNKSTGQVAPGLKAIEQELYGAAWGGTIRKRQGLDVRAEMQRLLRVLSGQEPPQQEGLGLEHPGGLAYWMDGSYRPNPVLRVSDTDARVIGDLTEDFGIVVCPTAKDDAEAQLYSLRNAFRDNKIEINPRCVDLIRHVEDGKWNDRHTDWQRYTDGAEAELYGHFDGVAMLMYLWRNIQWIRNVNPEPPEFKDSFDPRVMHVPSDWRSSGELLDLEGVL